MKNLILVSVLSLTSMVAMSAPLRCVTVPTRPDTGYIVTFNSRVDKALVEQVTIAGARKVASLVCSSPSSKTPNHPDKMSVWQCSEPLLRDAGYSAVLRIGGIAGFRDVTLSEVTFAGSREISRLRCR